MVTLSLPGIALGEPGNSELPPPPTASIVNQEQHFRLALVINRFDTGKLIPVIQRNGHFYIQSSELIGLGLPADKFSSPETDLTADTEIETHYDSEGQRLLLEIPTSWLPNQSIFTGTPNQQTQAVAGSGALFNYDVYTSHTQGESTLSSAWNEFRIFTPEATLSSTGILRKSFGDNSGDDNNDGFRRYDTTLSGVNEAHTFSWQVGDLITGALSWSNSVRLGGVTVGRDFSVRPDIITYPLPAFNGQTAVPTTADLFINGYQSASTNLEPGPFTLTNLPYVNGAGEAVLVTTDALGRRVSTTQPFYVASTLLKPGLSDATLSLGAIRRDYGEKDFSYGSAAASGSYRYGINDYLTLESHAEGAPELALGGLGSVIKLGYFGVLNSSVTTSAMYGKGGNQYDWGYQYSNSRFNVGTQHSRRDKNFGNLALYDVPQSNSNQSSYSLSKSSDQYSAAVSLDQLGSFGLAYFDIQSFAGDRTRLLNLSWNKSLWGNSTVYVSASRDPSQQDWALALSIQIPFNAFDNVSVTTQRSATGENQQTVNYDHAMPSDGGFKWNLAYANQSQQSNYQQATLGWRNEHVQLQGGVYGPSNSYTQWGEMMGALVYMDNTLLTANQINDSFVIVSTDGYPNIGVNFENQPKGTTNRQGYMLVPGVSSFYPSKFSIDTLSLPADIYADTTEQRISVRRNSGYVVHFPVRERRAASVILHDQTGAAIPLSSTVSQQGKPDAYVGWDGLAYLENLEHQNTLHVRTPNGQNCNVNFSLPENHSQKLSTYGPFICQLSATAENN